MTSATCYMYMCTQITQIVEDCILHDQVVTNVTVTAIPYSCAIYRKENIVL